MNYYWIVSFTSNIFLLFVFNYSNSSSEYYWIIFSISNVSILVIFIPSFRTNDKTKSNDTEENHLGWIIKQNRIIENKSFWTNKKWNWIIKKKLFRTSHFLFTTDVPFLSQFSESETSSYQWWCKIISEWPYLMILYSMVEKDKRSFLLKLFAISPDLVWKSPPSKKCWGYFLIRQFMDTHHYTPLFRTKFNAIW